MAFNSDYAQYKQDTLDVSMWLARVAIENGYSLSNFGGHDQSGSTPDDTSKVSSKPGAKKKLSKAAALQQIKQQQQQAALKPGKRETNSSTQSGQTSGSASARQEIPKGNYAIKVGQYVELANFIAEHKVDIPDHLLHRLYRCIKLRMRTLQHFLPNPDWSTFSHSHFLSVLQTVGSVLFTASEDIKKATTTSAVGGAERGTNTNRFASLETLEKCNDDIDEDIDNNDDAFAATLPASSTTPTVAVVQFNVEQNTEEVVMSTLAFFAAWVDMRTYIRNLWIQFGQGKSDLMTTSITTNLALEMLRGPHDELMSTALPFFEKLRGSYPSCDSALEIMLVHLYNAIASRYLKDHTHLTTLPSYKDAKAKDTGRHLVLETLCIPVYQVLKHVIQNSQSFPSPYRTDGFDEATTILAPPFVRWQQLEHLIFNSYADYLILLPIFGNNSSEKGNWFLTDGDEMAKSFFDCTERRETTLYATFTAVIFVDINFILGSGARGGMSELRTGAERMLGVLNSRAEKEPPHRGLDFPEWAETMLALTNTVQAHTFMDMATALANLKAPAPDLGRSNPRMLMYRSPMQCGTKLYRLHLHYGELGRALSDMWTAIPYAIQLYHICKNFGAEDPASYPAWPDLDHLLRIHDKNIIFGGKVPETAEDAHISHLKMQKFPINILTALRRRDEVLPLPGPRRKRIVAGERKTPLQEETQVTRLMKARYLQNVKVTPVDVSDIQALLIDIVNKEDDKARKQDSLSKDRRRRKKPEHNAQRLLQAFERVLWQESDKWRFDYFSMNLTAIEVLRRVQKALSEYMEVIFEDDYRSDPDSQLIELLTYITADASKVECDARKRGLPIEPARLRCGMLVKATDTLAKFLRDTGDGDKEIRKMAVHLPKQGRPPTAAAVNNVTAQTAALTVS